MEKEDKDDTERILSEEKQEDPEKKAKREIREEKLAIRDILNEIVSTKREILSLKICYVIKSLMCYFIIIYILYENTKSKNFQVFICFNNFANISH